ncbi:hypothetical protein [Mixta intestinalis]|uniref:Uncharacterized protein n=1 Tax=Mixta intestinalis TaxID=1615494 RepID=A0A6P1PXM8_9GAMM|nr:hypothetical protein [Mixta intestinalis]QHM71326.1 hypothetical protein C7M51_01612 [Mixta intestinalis]
MMDIQNLIKHEIGDFFAGFGGLGEPDIYNGDAQRELTRRILPIVAELQQRVEKAETTLTELAQQEPVAVPDHITYVKNLDMGLGWANDDNSPISHTARILATELKFWRSKPLFTRPAPPAPFVVRLSEHGFMSNGNPGWECNDVRAAIKAAGGEVAE